MSHCAFCSKAAKLTGEHIWSRWMGKLFTGKRYRFLQRDDDGQIIQTWTSDEVDQTAKVVCKPCNEGWMSNLEDRHAKPAMADLIVGNNPIRLDNTRARAIARFSFKTAVIVDHMSRGREPFFSKEVRYRFATSLTIPSTTQMWLAAFLPMGGGRLNGCYGAATFDADRSIEVYTCTYAVGHFVFQVVSAKWNIPPPSFEPVAKHFEYLSVPFWPRLYPDFVWPPQDVLRSHADFESFSNRWRAIRFV